MLACRAAISRSCSSVMRGQANSPAVASKASQTSNSSLTSFCVSLAARDPRFGSKTTSPSAARTLRASRSGVREIANDAHNSRSGIRAPGAISPSIKMCLRRETTSSCSMKLPPVIVQFTTFEFKICYAEQNIASSCCKSQILHSELVTVGFDATEITRLQPVRNNMDDTATLEADLLYEVSDGIGRIT